VAKNLGLEPLLHEACEITNSHFGVYTEVGRGSRVLNTKFGDYSYCDRFADIANAQIGKFANIASYTRIGPTDHPMHCASLHHFLYRTKDYWPDVENDAAFFAHRASRIVDIGHDVWLGHASVIRPEIKIGHGAVVASGAVVTHDVPDYMIVAGVPAKPLRKRFDDSIAERLIDLAWWDWSHEQLGQAVPDFRNLPIEAFLEKYA